MNDMVSVATILLYHCSAKATGNTERIAVVCLNKTLFTKTSVRPNLDHRPQLSKPWTKQQSLRSLDFVQIEDFTTIITRPYNQDCISSCYAQATSQMVALVS